MPELTPSEQQALMEAMRQGFGNCTCGTVAGRIMVCDGHRFLTEEQTFAGELTSRVMVLVYYRRMASLWTSAEFSRPFVSLEPEPMLEPTSLPESITGKPADPEKLPW